MKHQSTCLVLLLAFAFSPVAHAHPNSTEYEEQIENIWRVEEGIKALEEGVGDLAAYAQAVFELEDARIEAQEARRALTELFHQEPQLAAAEIIEQERARSLAGMLAEQNNTETKGDWHDDSADDWEPKEDTRRMKPGFRQHRDGFGGSRGSAAAYGK